MQISPTRSGTELVFRRVYVTGDWLPDDFAIGAYWDGALWNGFPVPLFSLEDGMALCAAMPSLAFDEVAQVFRMEDGEDQLWCPQVARVIDGRAVDLYLIGDSWCWQLAEAGEPAAANSEI
ncbi:hypothetical protein [Cupriavidus sp. WS]|uniref:hypothetical protein n=1 Tax=Cupriavidus sp. WS TaxID=1312922 RepID=UPI00035D6790|nr:hypothetical protein [Cupriavidus sp. WS]